MYMLMVEFYYHRNLIVLAGHFGTAVKEEVDGKMEAKIFRRQLGTEEAGRG